MQVFKAFFKIVRKNLTPIMMYLIIFLVITVIMTMNIKDTQVTSFSATSLDVAVVDRDHTTFSEALRDYIGKNHTVRELKDEKESLQESLYYRDVDYILIIPEGFANKLEQGQTEDLIENVKVPDSFSGIFVDNQVNTYVKALKTYIDAGFTDEEAVQQSLDAVNQSTKVNMVNAAKEDGKPTEYYYYEFLPYVFVCILIIGLGPILMTYKQKDLAARNKASAMSLKSLNLQLAAGSIVFGILVWLAFIVGSIVIIGPEVVFCTTGLLRILNAFIFMLVSMSIAILLSNLLTSLNALNLVSNVIGLGMSFVCGIFVPRDVLASGVVTASKFLPAYWYVDAAEYIQNYKTSPELSTILVDYGVQILFAVALFAIAMVISKIKVKER